MFKLLVSGFVLLLYAVVIVGFAYFYSGMDHAFYEDKIRLEGTYVSTTFFLSEEIRQSLYLPPCQQGEQMEFGVCEDFGSVDLGAGRSASIGNFGSNESIEVVDNNIVLRGWFPGSITGLGSSSNARADLDLGFELTFLSSRFPGDAPYTGHLYFPKDAKDRFYMKPTVTARLRFDYRDDLANLPTEQRRRLEAAIVQSRFRSRLGNFSPNGLTFSLFMPEAVLEKMDRYVRASTGYTSDLDDNFERMLYFSAITVTTVGFGDIIPITDTARRLVAVEAFLGIVLIGVFVNLILAVGPARAD